jgi:hypothetical protein
MYGLVNKAIEDLITNKFGEDIWQQIKAKAGVTVECFLAMEQYPDAVTYQLIGAACAVLQVSADELLRTFGNYWITFSSNEGYGQLLRMTGSSLFESLQKLDQLHARLSLSFPNYQPPSFRCTDISEKSLRLHYHSNREGLTFFVVGLLEGLATLTNTKAEIHIDKRKDQGHSHDEFLVTCC